VKKVYLLILFLIINFGGLALGNWFMGDAVTSEWYTSLNKAPWTPTSWVFGAIWILIMICFSIYLTYLITFRNSRFVIAIYTFTVLLNVSWNYLFFNQHLINISLASISALTLLIVYLFISFGDEKLSKMKYLLLPYIIWQCIATSLNGYIVFNN
jgi:benzodiazapine receptor